MKNILYKNKDFIITLTIVCAVSFYIFKFALIPCVVPSESMAPTFEVGDMYFENGFAYLTREPQRGDIVTFYAEDGTIYCKRVIGIAGDEIEFHDGYVYINGKQLDESSYLGEDVETNSAKTFTVPDNCVFVLGDNRENSHDSRYFDSPYISIDDVIGKYLFKMPFSVEGMLRLDNSKQSVKEEKTASDVDTLSIGEYGRCMGESDGDFLQKTVVYPVAIYTGDIAKDIIKTHGGLKKEPTEGTSFEVVEYYAYSEDPSYINVVIEGTDGECLKVGGISYTTRTYDANNGASVMGGAKYTNTKYYCYYEVPKGCKKYLLSFGLKGNDANGEELPTANYLITE